MKSFFLSKEEALEAGEDEFDDFSSQRKAVKGREKDGFSSEGGFDFESQEVSCVWLWCDGCYIYNTISPAAYI